MLPYLGFRRLSPPEHCHFHRAHTVRKSVLKQFWLATLARSRRWKQRCLLAHSGKMRGEYRLRTMLQIVIAEDRQQVAALALCIQESELREKPTLKFVRLTFTNILQLRYFLLILLRFGFCRFQQRCISLLGSMQFCLHILTFANHFLLFVLRNKGFLPPFVAQLLRYCHCLLCLCHNLLRFNFKVGKFFYCFCIIVRLLQRFNFAV